MKTNGFAAQIADPTALARAGHVQPEPSEGTLNSTPLCTRYRPDCETLDDLCAIRQREDRAPQYWVCRRPPGTVLGALLEEFSGVYLGEKNIAQVHLDQRQAQHPLPAHVRDWPAARLNALLAVILQMELDGQSAAFIAAAIAEFTQPQPVQEAA